MNNSNRHKISPLNAREKAWIEKLEKLLLNPPSKRLELYTIGDSTLTVIDGETMRKYDLEIHDGRAYSNGLVLGTIDGEVLIHGVSG